MPRTRRLLLRSGVGAVALVVGSAPASAHGATGDGGAPAAFAVVVGLPVLAGLLGGIVAARCRLLAGRARGRRHTDTVLGLLLVVLGGTLALTAFARAPSVTLAGGTAGAVLAALVARRETTTGPGRAGHAHLTLGAVCGHRVLEGTVVGALYSTGAAVGLVGAAILAGHTAIETAAVGGLYAGRRARAGAAILVVQLGYAAGAVAGTAVAGTVPAPARVGVLALAAGVLLATGLAGTGRSLVAGRPRDRPVDHETRPDVEPEH